jgi:hypothetical protein
LAYLARGVDLLLLFWPFSCINIRCYRY